MREYHGGADWRELLYHDPFDPYEGFSQVRPDVPMHVRRDYARLSAQITHLQGSAKADAMGDMAMLEQQYPKLHQWGP